VTDLDTLLRATLAAAAGEVEPTDPVALARDLHRARASRRRAHRARAVALAAAAVLLVVGASVLVRSAVSGDGDQARDRVQAGPPSAPTAGPTAPAPGGEGPPAAPTSFAGLGPGWHSLDPGPVPPALGAGLAWTGAELVIVLPDGSAWAHRPDRGTWRTLAPAPLAGGDAVELAWTGTEVVAVARGSRTTSAAWDPGTGTWRDLGAVPVAPELAAALGSLGIVSAGAAPALVWSGERLFDMERLAALDPTTGQWEPLALPADLVAFTSLLYTNAVWDGTEVLAVNWIGSGLAWDPSGTSFREVAPAATELGSTTGSVPFTRAVAVGGEVVLVSGLDDPGSGRGTGGVAALDARTGRWRRLPDVPGVNADVGCPYLVEAVAGQVVVQRCDQPSTMVLRDGRWQPNGTPALDQQCCGGRWQAAGDALVVWSSDTDTVNNDRAPYVEAAVWVPEDR